MHRKVGACPCSVVALAQPKQIKHVVECAIGRVCCYWLCHRRCDEHLEQAGRHPLRHRPCLQPKPGVPKSGGLQQGNDHVRLTCFGGGPQAVGARFPATPRLIYPLTNEALRPERAGCRDRFAAG